MAEYRPPASDATNTDEIESANVKLPSQPPNGVNVVVIGATGATGRYVVAELLLAPEIACVAVVTRRKYEIPREYTSSNQVMNAAKDGRLIEHVLDLEAVSDDKLMEIFENKHTFFSCMGSSKSAAGSKERYVQIEMAIPLRFARIAKEKGVKHTSLISGALANENSFIFYAKVKGRIEAGLNNIGFPVLSIWKPGTLSRKDTVVSFQEKVLNFFTHPLPTDDLARAIVQKSLLIVRGMTVSNNPSIYMNPQIKQLNLERLNELQNIIKPTPIQSGVPADKVGTIEAGEHLENDNDNAKELGSAGRAPLPNSDLESAQPQVKDENEVADRTEDVADLKPEEVVNQLETQLDPVTPAESPSVPDVSQPEIKLDTVTPATESPSVPDTSQLVTHLDTVTPATESPSVPDTSQPETKLDTVTPATESPSVPDASQSDTQLDTVTPATESPSVPDTSQPETKLDTVTPATESPSVPDASQSDTQLDTVTPATESLSVPDTSQLETQLDTVTPATKHLSDSALASEPGPRSSPGTEKLSSRVSDQSDDDTTPTPKSAGILLSPDSDMIHVPESPGLSGDTTLSIGESSQISSTAKQDKDTTNSSFQTAISSELNETVDSHSPESVNTPTSSC